LDIQIVEFHKAIPSVLCDHIIERFEADSRKFRSNYSEQSQGRDYRQAEILSISPLSHWKFEDEQLFKIVQKLCSEYMARFKTGEPLVDYGYTVAKYGVGDGCLEHKDTSSKDPEKKLLSLVFFLNDVDEGGELVFPLHDVKIKPEKGKAVLYPAMFTHRHFVEPVKSNPRYAVITFLGYPQKG
jgi:2OG-Fe(II) oxygenase superfamily